METAGPSSCSLTVFLVTEVIDQSLEEHLPINTMRNQAVLLAQTPLIAMLDADMVVSQSLAQSLADPADAEVRLLLTWAQWILLIGLVAGYAVSQCCIHRLKPCGCLKSPMP